MTSRLSPLLLNAGNIASVGIYLYQTHWGRYLRIALASTLWFLNPFVFLAATLTIAIALSSSPWIYAGIAIAFIAIAAYSWAKGQWNMALISRLVFADLIQQPESPQQARQKLKSKLWSVLLVQIMVGFLFGAAQSAVSFVLIPVFGVLSVLMGAFVYLYGIVSILGNLLSLGIYLLVYACLFIPELPLIIEPELGPVNSISRNWQLSRRSLPRIVMTITIAMLVSLPFYTFAMLIPTVLLSTLLPRFTELGYQPLVYQSIIATLLIGAILLLLTNLVVMPIWQSIKAVLYYDLRSRHEGFDLRLRYASHPVAMASGHPEESSRAADSPADSPTDSPTDSRP